MNKMSSVKKLTVTAVCVALCCVLPVAFHAVGLGTALSPLHIPALLCGVLCGPVYGLLCGFAGPLLASVINGMPGPAILPSMVPEIMAYGLVTGLMLKLVRTKNTTADLYVSLGVAMIAGRVVGGIAKGHPTGEEISGAADFYRNLQAKKDESCRASQISLNILCQIRFQTNQLFRDIL